MCLSVFCDGDATKYNALKESAMKLGSAFQKVNFLRDLNEDVSDLGRTYFPSLNMQNFDQSTKTEIEKDIEDDFKKGYLGILKLPKSSRLGVYLAYVYYNALFNKIKKIEPKKVLAARVRIPNQRKYSMLIGSYIKYNLNII
jgi:phytoene synthase